MEARRLTPYECLAIFYVTFGAPGHPEIDFYGPINAKPDEVARWFDHGFNFVDGNPFLVQPWPGPCGVLAVVQCYIFIKLIYGVLVIDALVNDDVKQVLQGGSGENLLELSQTTHKQKFEALAEALAFMIWQAANEPGRRIARVFDGAQLVTLSDPTVILQQDQPMRLTTTRYMTYDALLAGVLEHMDQFRSKSGILLLVFSMIRSRTVQVVLGDRDEPLSFVELYGNMSQSLLNIGISGQAVQNCFDGQRNVGGLIMFGIHKKSLIGSLYHSSNVGQGHLEVGLSLKNPSYGLWACGNGFHYTTLALLNPLYTVFPPFVDQMSTHRRVRAKLIQSYNRYLTLEPPQFEHFLKEFQYLVGYRLKPNQFTIAIGKLQERTISEKSVEDFFKGFMTTCANNDLEKIKKVSSSSSVDMSSDGGVRFINLIRWDGLFIPQLTRFILGAEDFNQAQSNDEALIRTREEWDFKKILSWTV